MSAQPPSQIVDGDGIMPSQLSVIFLLMTDEGGHFKKLSSLLTVIFSLHKQPIHHRKRVWLVHTPA